MAQKQAVNHLHQYNKRVNEYIDKTKASIAKSANSIPADVTESNKERRQTVAKAQIEVLNVLKGVLPGIYEKIEYMR